MDTLHCTMFAMSCISFWSCWIFFIRSSKTCICCLSSIRFFPDRIAKWCGEIRQVLRMFLGKLKQASISPILLPLQKSLTYFILPSPLCYLWVAFLSRVPSTCYLKQPILPPPTSYSCCLVIGSALRVVVHASAIISRYRYCYLIGLSVGEHDTWFMDISVVDIMVTC